VDEVKDKNILVKIYFYLCKEVTGGLLEEWADLLQVGAVGHVLELGAVLHVGNEGAGSLALDCRATLLGQLSTRFGIEGAHSSRLKQNSKNKKSHTMKEKKFHLVQILHKNEEKL
jgi:hypothetical protein